MRILSDEPCKVTFTDNIAGGKITLEYRLPTPDERVIYSNALITRKGKKVESAYGETRQKWGYNILTGITDGEFGRNKKTPISSSPQSPIYDAEWKEIVKKFAPDVIERLAMHVFENALTISEVEEEENPT
jgi:hypothetical protein